MDKFFLTILLIFTGALFFIVETCSGSTINHKKHGSDECVVLLHGLTRTKKSMKKLEEVLSGHGYRVFNMDYPSRKYTIEKLSYMVIQEALSLCSPCNPQKIHFITHSMGGILVRYYLSKKSIAKLGRVVMLSPPNQGSCVVDKLKNMPGFKALNGPAGIQLGTGKNSIPLSLGKVDYEVGIITGNRSINLILSLLIPGDDDGKVSVENAKLAGMSDFIVLPYCHPFIMKSKEVIDQSIYFLQNGSFKK